MATTRTFSAMLNEYLPNKLLKEELLKRDWLLSNIEIDDTWKGGKLIVPFKAAGASSISMGALTASDDIAEDSYVRGYIDGYKEMWGSMIFNQRDFLEHDGRVNEDSFLKILPDAVEDFMDFCKMSASIQLGTGPHFATVTDATNAASGIMVVDRIDRFALGQKVTLDDDDSSAGNYYVTAINVNTSEVTLSATRGGGAANVSAFSVAQNAKFYTVGANTAGFTSLKAALLSNANGGDASIHNVTKTSYPFTQAVNISGSSITASNIIEKIFDAYTTVRTKARGKATKVLMSYKHFGSVLKLLDINGAANYNVNVSDKKASVYGWDEIELTTVKGKLTFVGIQEWSDSEIVFLDPKSIVFRSNGFFQKRKSPEGQEYYEVRNTTGYQYILDILLFGELEVSKPGNNAIIYSISY